MNKLKWGFRILLLVIAGLFLHYTLPHHDVVRITNTYNRLTTVGTENSWAYASPDVGTGENAATRDIRFIEASFPNGSVIVYRNEDTGWVWPPYFKYDSSNLQAEAGNLKSLTSAPTWVSVTYYGWRMPFLSIYPNAVAVKEVAGPDVTIIPYVPIIVLIFLLFIVIMLRRMWAQFVERTVEPTLAGVEETWDGVEERAERAKGRAGSWLSTWRKKK